MASSPDTRRRAVDPPADFSLSPHRFAISVVGPLPRPIVSANLDPRIW
jgi:hypothetical protein